MRAVVLILVVVAAASINAQTVVTTTVTTTASTTVSTTMTTTVSTTVTTTGAPTAFPTSHPTSSPTVSPTANLMHITHKLGIACPEGKYMGFKEAVSRFWTDTVANNTAQPYIINSGAVNYTVMYWTNGSSTNATALYVSTMNKIFDVFSLNLTLAAEKYSEGNSVTECNITLLEGTHERKAAYENLPMITAAPDIVTPVSTGSLTANVSWGLLIDLVNGGIPLGKESLLKNITWHMFVTTVMNSPLNVLPAAAAEYSVDYSCVDSVAFWTQTSTYVAAHPHAGEQCAVWANAIPTGWCTGAVTCPDTATYNPLNTSQMRLTVADSGTCNCTALDAGVSSPAVTRQKLVLSNVNVIKLANGSVIAEIQFDAHGMTSTAAHTFIAQLWALQANTQQTYIVDGVQYTIQHNRSGYTSLSTSANTGSVTAAAGTSSSDDDNDISTAEWIIIGVFAGIVVFVGIGAIVYIKTRGVKSQSDKRGKEKLIG